MTHSLAQPHLPCDSRALSMLSRLFPSTFFHIYVIYVVEFVGFLRYCCWHETFFLSAIRVDRKRHVIWAIAGTTDCRGCAKRLSSDEWVAVLLWYLGNGKLILRTASVSQTAICIRSRPIWVNKDMNRPLNCSRISILIMNHFTLSTLLRVETSSEQYHSGLKTLASINHGITNYFSMPGLRDSISTLSTRNIYHPSQECFMYFRRLLSFVASPRTNLDCILICSRKK